VITDEQKSGTTRVRVWSRRRRRRRGGGVFFKKEHTCWLHLDRNVEVNLGTRRRRKRRGFICK